jgi:hypothetical protein
MSPKRDPDLARRALRARRRRDIAVILPLLGLFLFLSPVIRIAQGPSTIWGIPHIFIYLFGVWLILILLTRRLSRHLIDDPRE